MAISLIAEGLRFEGASKISNPPSNSHTITSPATEGIPGVKLQSLRSIMHSSLKRKKGSLLWISVAFVTVLSQLIFLIVSIQHHDHDQQHLSWPLRSTDKDLPHPATVKDEFGIKNKALNFDTKIPNLTRFHAVPTDINVMKLPHANPFSMEHHRANFERPPLSDLSTNLENNTILHDVDFLLDFGIIGFAKVRERHDRTLMIHHPREFISEFTVRFFEWAHRQAHQP